MQHKNIHGIAVSNRTADNREIVETRHATSLPHTMTFIALFLISLGAHAQTNPISLTAKNTPIKQVFAEIQQKSGYRILYNDEVVADDLHVSLTAENTSVKDILNTLLKDTDLTYIMQSDELIIITKRQYVSQRTEVFGTVTDEKGAPVPYANVVLLQPDDTTRLGYGAVTDEAGYYKLANVNPTNTVCKCRLSATKRNIRSLWWRTKTVSPLCETSRCPPTKPCCRNSWCKANVPP